jgi:UDP-glucuronate 4-epimerase
VEFHGRYRREWPIRLFNDGRRMRRDFTYIDDVVDAVVRPIDLPLRGDPLWPGDDPDPATSRAPWRVYNVGNNQPVEVNELVRLLEQALGKQATLEFAPTQPGADVPDLAAAVGFAPKKASAFWDQPHEIRMSS